MSLPPPLAAKIKSIPMDPLALANNVELAYMLSFSNYHLSPDSVQCSAKDSYNSPLESYNFVDFDDSTYETLYAETKKNYQYKNSTTVKSIRNSFKEFFTRISAMTYSAALKKDELLSAPSSSSLKIPTFQAQFKIDQMKGNNPNDWPRNLKQFHEQLSKLPWNAFACEPELYYDDFFKSAFAALKNSIKRYNSAQNKGEASKQLFLIVEIIVMISARTNNQTYILSQMETINSYDLDKILAEKECRELLSRLQTIFQDVLDKVPVDEEQEYHAPKKLWEKGQAFMIMKKIHFQKQNGLAYFTVTNDGTYLYIYISSINGGMYKIGTGKNSSIAGKIYFQKQILLPVGSKLDEINWVFCKGKLYLKSGSREPNSIQIINPETFKSEGIIELKCLSFFGHQSLINLNRNSILLTDGHKLYFLGKQLKIKQSKEEKKQQEIKPIVEQQQKAIRKKKQKKQKSQQNATEAQKSNPEQIDKVIQFVLLQFQLQEQTKDQQCDEKLIEDLFLSFNGYFTKSQCKKALLICEYDLSDSAQWLVDQAEKQRSTRALYPTSKVVIAEADITSNFSQKNLKGSNEITTKEGSILHTQNIHQSIWTMDQEQVTCYSEAGFKIFSKSQADSHNISQNSSLRTTHLKTLEGKIQRNPQYTITYDPYNRIFYTFTWPIDGGHYFPTAVLIGSDYKQAVELNHQKKISLSQTDPKKLRELPKWLLTKMNMLDNNHCPEQGRINNWLWLFAQKIVEINKQINSNNESDKKKLTNKRSKFLTKMNKVNEYYDIYQNNKKEFELNGKVTVQIKSVPPFGSDGSAENLSKIRSVFDENLEHGDFYDFIYCLEGWLINSPKITDKKSTQILRKIRDQLIELKPRLNPNALRKLNNLFIQNFFEFFHSSSDQQQFIMSLEKNQIKLFVQKYPLSRFKGKKSIVYEIKSKDNLIQKFDSKNKFEEVFPISSNIPLKQVYQNTTIGNIFVDTSADKKQKDSFYKFLERQISENSHGIKLIEHLFLQAFRAIVKNRHFSEYRVQLDKLFIDVFTIFQKVITQANSNLLKQLTDPLNEFLQIYFASLCSLTPSIELIECFMKILQQLQKKEIASLFNLIEDFQFQGISQTFQKIYQTPHPIQRGKNQNFPPFKNPQASLIYAQFDKRCQSDPNHDTLSIQITHENSPVGNSINCNDGVFTTNLRLTGKLDSGKPYLIMGNSVNVDFVSSGHAKDAKSFGRFGFKFGLRPIFAGKIKYKKQGIERIQKVFGVKIQFEKYLNTLKLLTIILSNSIQNIINTEREEHQVHEISKFLNGKIFKQGYEQQSILSKMAITESQQSLDNLLSQKKSKDGRLLLIKALHTDSLSKPNVNNQNQILPKNKSVKQNSINIWNVEGIPAYIRSYVEKIKNFSGDFIDVFLEARSLAIPKGVYALQMRKSGFTEELKKLWLQGEAILFLTVLKHSGLLHLNLKFSIQYIKANLKAFQEARNGIYEALIRRMQSERQWRDLIETFEGEKEVKEEQKISEKVQDPIKTQKIGGVQIKKKGMATKTIKLENKNKGGAKVEKKVQKKQEQVQAKQEERKKKQAEKAIRERLTEDYMIKQLCELKNIEYHEKQTMENVTRIIGKIENQIKENKKCTQSVYIQPMNQLIRSCVFLLKMKSPSTKQTIGQQQVLEPEMMSRCYSQDVRHVNTNKVNVFRQWLENWKKWKEFKKEGKVELKFPVSEIIDFVNSWLPHEAFKSQIDLRNRIAQNRIKFYEYNNSLLKAVSNTFLSKYVVGTEVANIKGSFSTGLESVSNNCINELTDKFTQYSHLLKLEQQRKLKQLPLKLKDIQNLVKSEGDNLIDRIKLTSLHLYLIESENQNVDLDIGLYFTPFKFLSNTNQELIFIASLIVQRALISNHSLDEILAKIWKEIGNDTISCKRWSDYYFIERILFLLRKLQHKCRQRLEVTEKQKVAEVLFHIIYMLQIPLVCRISLRILSLLKIALKRDIDTPLSKTYKAISLGEGCKVEQFKIQNKQGYNNLELIAIKCSNVFKGDFKNEVREKMLEPFKQIVAEDQKEKENNYTVILNMNQEQDVVWMVTVLYYLEEVEKNITPIKDWEEYQLKKNKKKQHHKQKQQKQVAAQQIPNSTVEKIVRKALEQRIFQNVPNDILDIPDSLQSTLPAGWFFNYCNVYNQYTSKNPLAGNLNAQNAPNLTQKKGKNANQAINPNAVRKPWNPVEFLKLYKKFQELTSKPLEEPKEEQSEQIKSQFVKAKNFISRIRKHSAQVSVIYSNLSQNGFYAFRQDISKERCQIICQLFSLGSQNKLKSIPCEFNTKDYATKLSPVYVLPTKKSELKITCIRSDQYRRFNDIINAPSSVQVKVENNPLLFYTTLGNTQFTFEDKCHLPYEQLPEIDSNQDNQKIEFAKYFIESSLSRMNKRQDEVYLKQYPKLKYFLSQGGLESGLESCTLVPAFDSNLTSQKSRMDQIIPAAPKHQMLDDIQQLLDKAINLMKQDFSEIKSKDNFIPYILLSCYLQKICNLDIKFVQNKLLKQFEEKLSKFTKGFRADHSTKKYKQNIQVLITKSLDSSNSNLSHFRLYRYDEQDLNSDLLKFIDNDRLRSSIRQEKGEATPENINSHQIQKSSYQLPIHTPIPEQNKLLKYWEKNILPKILDFVKSSLKPMQIQDFFEQMRIPLRKGDQLQAKKIAYVICDNKLPQGAVLPDSNHNWNSLTIQDITVGQDVLLRLPKSKSESSSPLMWSQSQQYRVAQVLFIDQKNFSALIRHRLSEYSIYVYSWVPINSLEAVQQSLAHYSLATIYKKMQSCLKGIIYNYSKVCMTEIAKKIKINMESLIQQTIIDMSRDNPISGWSQNKDLPLKSALKSQLSEGNTQIVQIVQKKFCPLQSYDIDLFSENIINLNKFTNCLGLIVTFKKASSLIWYSGIRFYADQFGYKEIANTYASKSCVNELQPLQFKNPNVYCRYYTNKQFLKAYQQNKYEQKQIFATVTAVDPAWTVSTYLANTIGEIAVQQGKYEDLLTRLNFVFLKWLQKKQCIYLTTQLCRVIIKNTLRIRKIYLNKQKTISFQSVGSSQQQIKSLIQWINVIKLEEDKDVLVLYTPLLQNLIQLVASLLSGIDKVNHTNLNLPTYIQEIIKLIQMTAEIQNSLNGKKTKKQMLNNDTQWERILLIQNIPSYITEEEVKKKVREILMKNNGKILSPSFDIFYSNGQAVILVDSWDITELIQEEVIEKIENEEEKQPEPQEGGLLMEWQCQVCTFINPMGSPSCGMCDSPAPAPKAEAIFQKVQTKDVNQTEMKLRQKEMKRFENVKDEIKSFIRQCWVKQCNKLDLLKQQQEKNKQQRRKKKGKMVQNEQKTFDKPAQPKLQLSSGSPILQKKIIEQFLKNRFKNLPQSITKKVAVRQNSTYLGLFKELAKLGYDLWGDNIGNEQPSLLRLEELSQLMQYIQDEICKGSSSVLSYNEGSIRMINQIPLLQEGGEQPINFSAENNIGVRTKYKRLSEQASYNNRYSWKMIKELNLSASKCLQFINMKLMDNEQKKVICSTHTIGANLKCLRQLVMGALKLQLFQKIMQRTSVILEPQDIPKINLQRLKIRQDRDSKRIQKLISFKDRDDFLFTKAHEQLEKVSSINLRPFKPKGTEPYLSFIANFKGQQVQGEAGPYRQFFTDVTNELNPELGLGMFIKTPNNLHKTGEGREKQTINPKANSTYYLSLFHFLGRLMGCCIRTGCHIPLNLATFCWKLIADEKIKQSDLEQIDRQFNQQNKFLLQCPSQSTFDAMEETVGQPVTWVYTSMDGEEQELKTNGRLQRVKYEQRHQYVSMMQRKRQEQIGLQVEKIRQGLSQMIPESYLNHLSGEELKILVCGVPKVDVQLLRKHTKYAGGLSEESPVIKYFWEMMREIPEKQRLTLIRFCWGQQRLPLNSEEFERNGIRFMIKPSLNNKNPDLAHPKADTCFFNIELPNYSSKEILKQKVLFAINLDDTSMNADRNLLPDDNPLMGNVDYEDEGQGEDQQQGGGG